MVDPKRKDTARRCAFCDSHQVSREHVWPRWIAKLMHERYGEADWNVLLGDKERSTKALDAMVKRVCEDCNNTWMSVIENETQPILAPMMMADARSTRLSPESQRILSTWAMKTMLMADFLYPEGTRALRPEMYSRFFTDRGPPKNQSVVWTAAYSGPKLLLGSAIMPIDIEMSHQYGRDGVLVPSPPTVQKDIGTICTLRVLHAVFQLIVYRGLYAPMGHEADGRLIQRIWPAVETTILWPAHGRALDDAGIMALASRRGHVRSLRQFG
jgi:hypothetical protein